MNDPTDQDHDELDELDLCVEKVMREFFDSEVTRLGVAPAVAPGAAGVDAPESAFVLPRRVGRYSVTALIGSGGLGMVLRATDPELGREIAIKLLRPRHGADADVIASFLEEARVTSQLQHPGIVPIHEVGRTAEGAPFFTMKIVEGETLAHLLRQRATPREDRLRFLRLFAQACDAVAFAHNAGVVHRDLKPGNVMVGRFGEVQVLDWGFAMSTRGQHPHPIAQPDPDPASRSTTTSTRVLGTPAYMAPEQAHGRVDDIDARTDVFALGATLTEILTGAPPYLADSPEEVYLKATRSWQQDAHDRLAICGADVALVALARRCLSPDQDARPADAAEVAAGIEQYLSALDQRNQELQLMAAEARAHARDQRRRRRLTLGMAMAIGVAAIAVGSYAWMKSEAQRALDVAIARARAFVEQAQEDAPEVPGRWHEALVAVEQAATFAEADSPEIERLLAQVRAGDAQAQRDRAFLDWLSGPRLQLAYDISVGSKGLGTEYTAAFRQWGVDVVDLDVEAAGAVIRASKIALQLVNGLDRLVEFLRLTGTHTAPDASLWRRLVAIAMAADRDPWRNRIRQAWLDDDLATLQGIAQADEIRRAPLASLDLLGRSLRVLGDQAAAIAVLREAARRWPHDYQIVHSLELCMHQVGAPPRDILWLSLLGVSIRPDSAHAWHHLADALNASGDKELARQAFQRMSDLGPRYPLAASVLTLQRGRQLLDQGYVTQAARLFEQLIESRPEDDNALFFHALAMSTLHDTDAATRSLRSALAIRETAERRCNLGWELRMAGRFAEAVGEISRGHELSGQREDLEHSSADWIRSAAELQARAALLAESDDAALPTAAEERAGFALVALLVGQPGRALRLFREAFAADPLLGADCTRKPENFDASYREFAAAAAVRAATRHDGEAAAMTADDRTAALEQALVWLQDELDGLERRAESLADRADLRARVSRLLYGPTWAPVRSDQQLGGHGLDAAQRDAWRGFWSRAESSLVATPAAPAGRAPAVIEKR